MGWRRFCRLSISDWRRRCVRAIVGKVSSTTFLGDVDQPLVHHDYAKSRGLKFLSWYVIRSRVRLEHAGLKGRVDR